MVVRIIISIFLSSIICSIFSFYLSEQMITAENYSLYIAIMVLIVNLIIHYIFIIRKKILGLKKIIVLYIVTCIVSWVMPNILVPLTLWWYIFKDF